jgi:carboxyl-terminal processing protease
MNKKISVGICISLIVIACTVTFVVTWTIAFNMFNNNLPAVQRNEISLKLQEIDAFIRNNFLGEISEDGISFGLFDGYIGGLNDPNSLYLTAEQYRQQLGEESGQFVTAGIRAEPEISGYLIVTEVYTGSSAMSAEIRRGDLITEVNGRSVLLGAETALQMLDGDANTRVEITIQRDGEVFPHSLVRHAIDVASVDSNIIDEIGFIQIMTFNELTAVQFHAALQTFSDSEIRALLIDLRDNSSSVFTQVESMSNALIGAGTIARTEHRGGVIRDFIVTDDTRVQGVEDIPVIVLTNSGTAGAGELFAAILRSHAGAQIIGTGTAGNAYVRQTHPLRDGSAIRVTVARISLTNGVEFAGSGLTPDFAEEMEAPVSYIIAELRDRELQEIEDPQIRRAFEIINTVQ